jgi:putative zinc finger/helix-turn-helix YgiT family protein
MKKTIRKRPASARETAVPCLPADACPDCGAMMCERRGLLHLPVNGEDVAAPDVPHLRCPRCREVVLRMDQARELRQRAFETYRRVYGLLAADEIRAIRERHGLTQAQLARLLRLGANTLSRWEAGRIVQTAAMDVLLRLVRDVPGSLDYLRRGAG